VGAGKAACCDLMGIRAAHSGREWAPRFDRRFRLDAPPSWSDGENVEGSP
jgi:hypothetical protein